MLAKAEQATQRGDYEQALALLERAQRIDPDSAEVYLCMAQTHRARGNAAQARATAERGLLYCSTEALCDALRAMRVEQLCRAYITLTRQAAAHQLKAVILRFEAQVAG